MAAGGSRRAPARIARRHDAAIADAGRARPVPEAPRRRAGSGRPGPLAHPAAGLARGALEPASRRARRRRDDAARRGDGAGRDVAARRPLDDRGHRRDVDEVRASRTRAARRGRDRAARGRVAVHLRGEPARCGRGSRRDRDGDVQVLARAGGRGRVTDRLLHVLIGQALAYGLPT